jgi:hypothetical protein
MSNLFKSKFFLGMMVVATLLVGVVAVKTAAAQSVGSSMAATTTATCTISTTLKVGSKGADVKCLQSSLGLTADGSFGPKTKAAVVAWQKSNGLTADGVVGAKSRAVFNKGGTVTVTPVTTTLPADCTAGVMFSPSTGTPCTSATTAPQGTGPVSVSLSSDNPASGYVINNQATADLAHFTFSGSGTVTSVTLQRTGISDQNTLTNVYLFQGNTRLTDGYSFNNTGVLTMNGLNIAVNGTTTISVKADVYAHAGDTASTIGVNLTSYTAGATATAVNLVGNSMYVGTGSPATASVGVNTVTGTQTVNAGTSAYTVWSAPVQVNTRAVWLKGANFRITGSAPAGSLGNISLFVDGSKVGTVATMGMITGSNYAMFDFSASPVSLSTGSHTISVEADIVKGASYTAQVALQQASDLVVYDSQVGINIAALTTGQTTFTSNSGANITIAAGSASVNVDPTFQSMTNVTGGATNVPIARFKIHGYGEDVKVSTLYVTPVITGVTNGGLNNLAVYFNGSQVGSSQTWTSGQATFNLGSQMIIPAGTDSYIEVRADLQSTSSVNYTTGYVSANLTLGTNNAQGQTSSTTLNFPTATVTGTVLSIQTGLLAVSPDASLATAQTSSPNTAGVVIGSYAFQNQSTSESVRVTQLQVGLTSSASLTNLSNLRTSETSGSGSNPIQPTANNTFSVNFTLAPGATKTIQILADTGASISGTSAANTNSPTLGAVPTTGNGATATQVNTVTLTGPATGAGATSATINGVLTSVAVANTEASTVTATNLANAINANNNINGNVSAVAGGSVVTVTSKTTGTVGAFTISSAATATGTTAVSALVTAAANGTAQVETYTVGSDIKAGNVYTVTINGHAATYTALSGDTVPTVSNGLRTAINALATGVTATGTTTVTVTANVAGTAFAVGSSSAVVGVGPTTATVNTTLVVTSIGVTSNVSTTSATQTGQTITLSAGVLGGTPTLSSNSTAAQYVPAASGATNATKATFNFTSSGGASTITELTFNLGGNSTISSVTVNGLTAYNVGGTAYLTGLNIAVPFGGSGINQDVYVTYAKVGQGGVQSGTTSQLTLTTVKYQSGGTTTVIGNGTGLTQVSSPIMTMVGTVPTVAINAASSSLTVGLVHVADVTVAANSAGDLNVNTIPLVFTGSQAATTFVITNTTDLVLKDASGSTITGYTVGTISAGAGVAATTDSAIVTFTNGYQVPAGTTKTFQVFATIHAIATGTGNSVATGVTPIGSFTWTDTAGNATLPVAASATTMPSYPTNTVSLSN